MSFFQIIDDTGRPRWLTRAIPKLITNAKSSSRLPRRYVSSLRREHRTVAASYALTSTTTSAFNKEIETQI